MLDVVEQCGHKGVHGLVILSGGFGERGDPAEQLAGRQAQRRLVEVARAHGMRVVGPDCPRQVVNTEPSVRLNATLAPRFPTHRRAGFFCQSGALGVAVLGEAARRGLGVSRLRIGGQPRRRLRQRPDGVWQTDGPTGRTCAGCRTTPGTCSTTSVRSSVSQYCSRSLPDTSARLPADTNVDTPEAAAGRLAEHGDAQRAGLAEEAGPSGSGGTGASEALSRTDGSVLTMPRQFGPTTRMPFARAARDQVALRLRARRALGVVAALAEPAGDDDQAAHAAGGALVHDVGDRGGRHRDDGEVESSGHVAARIG